MMEGARSISDHRRFFAAAPMKRSVDSLHDMFRPNKFESVLFSCTVTRGR